MKDSIKNVNIFFSFQYKQKKNIAAHINTMAIILFSCIISLDILHNVVPSY